jgi:hypothetical protein
VPQEVRDVDNGQGVIGHGALWALVSWTRIHPVFLADSHEWYLKFPWYRTVAGTPTVSGRRLDGPGRFHADVTPPGEYPDTGFLPSGLYFTTRGCWLITGQLASDQLTVHIKVH